MPKPTKTSPSIKIACSELQIAMALFERAIEEAKSSPSQELQQELKLRFAELQKKLAYLS